MALADQHQFSSIAFPIIGAGTGGYAQDAALRLMTDALEQIESTAHVIIVRYRPAQK